jgi:hypothetical protein
MNEPYSAIAPMEPAPMPYKDRSGGLVAFGVMTLLKVNRLIPACRRDPHAGP